MTALAAALAAILVLIAWSGVAAFLTDVLSLDAAGALYLYLLGPVAGCGVWAVRAR
ncbi:MAG: hypothetical protein ACOY4R_27640 [Pseudomonadota bacterium]